MYRFGPGFHHTPGVFGWFLLALLVAMIALGVVALVRLWGMPRDRLPHAHLGPLADPAITELRIRYARGELTLDDFTRMSADLGYPTIPAGPPVPPGGAAAPPSV